MSRCIRLAVFVIAALYALPAASADRYFVVGGSGNFNTTASWSTTTGGSGGSSIPGTSDVMILDANSPSLTMNSTGDVGGITATNYVGTVTMSNQLTTRGSVTLGAGMTFAGASRLRFLGASGSTLTTNGKVITVPLAFDVNGTITLGDVLNVSGNLEGQCGGCSTTFSGNSVNVTGGTLSGGFAGSPITLSGTSTWATSALTSTSLTFAGNVTVSGAVSYRGGSLIYSSGTITTTGSTLSVGNASTTFNTAGITWNDISVDCNCTLTISSALTVGDDLTFTAGGATITANTSTIDVYGDLNVLNSVTVTGSSPIVLHGAGTVTVSSTSILQNNLEFNAPAATINVASFRYGTGTITYTAGNLTGKILITESEEGGGGDTGARWHAPTWR